MKNKIVKLLMIVIIFCAVGGHEVSAVKKAVFPDEKLLQPMPNAYFVHPNISGNINSTTNVLPNQESASNATNTKSDTTAGQANDRDNGNPWIFYLIWCVIVLIIASVIIRFYKKLKRK